MDPWAESEKRPRGALPATGDLLAALVGVGEWPEGSVVAVGDTAGSLRGSCAVVVLPADSFARLALQHRPGLRMFKVNVVLWVLPRAKQPLCVLLLQGS